MMRYDMMRCDATIEFINGSEYKGSPTSTSTSIVERGVSIEVERATATATTNREEKRTWGETDNCS